MKLTAMAGAVFALLRVKTRAYINSFQEKMRENIPETATPGAANGKQIERKIRH